MSLLYIDKSILKVLQCFFIHATGLPPSGLVDCLWTYCSIHCFLRADWHPSLTSYFLIICFPTDLHFFKPSFPLIVCLSRDLPLGPVFTDCFFVHRPPSWTCVYCFFFCPQTFLLDLCLLFLCPQTSLLDLPDGDMLLRVKDYKVDIIVELPERRYSDGGQQEVVMHKFGEIVLPIYVNATTLKFEYDDDTHYLRLRGDMKGFGLRRRISLSTDDLRSIGNLHCRRLSRVTAANPPVRSSSTGRVTGDSPTGPRSPSGLALAGSPQGPDNDRSLSPHKQRGKSGDVDYRYRANTHWKN